MAVRGIVGDNRPRWMRRLFEAVNLIIYNIQTFMIQSPQNEP